MAPEVKVVKAKTKCCKDDPRCKRCPVVLKRLAKEGLASREGDKYVLAKDVAKKRVKAARAR
jgi:hypothetical protein